MTATSAQPNAAASRRLLVVDDDSVTRMLIVHHLKRNGYTVLAAQGVEEAKATILREKVSTLHAVVTDYLMPDGTGLELIEWLKGADETIGAIVVTAVGERDLVKQSLRGGACDFLDKPIQIEALLGSVRNAVEHTERGRHLRETESSVKEVGKFQQFMLGAGTEGVPAPVDICWHPMHPVGGDLVNVIPLSPHRLLLLAADVSGHDLKAGFISAFFQGVVRGMVEKGTPIEEVFAYFNRFLISEWSRSQDAASGGDTVAASICACAFVIDFAQKQLAIYNCGFPVPLFTDAHGRSEPCCQEPGFPLGWFPDNPVSASHRDISTGGAIHIWTDGLEELAAHLGTNPVAVATELLAAKRQGRTAECLRQANDDILLVQLNLSRALPPSSAASATATTEHSPTAQGIRPGGGTLTRNRAVAGTPASTPAASTPPLHPHAEVPIIYQELFAGQERQVDEFQENWTRSLRLAFPALPEDKLFDVLLCAREAVINAIRYGCSDSLPGRSTFQVSCDAARTLLRVVVSDQGPGHDFRWETHVAEAAENLINEHRGLALMHQIPTQTRVDRNGALVTMEFALLQP